MPAPLVSIGALSQATGCSVPTIRYYEEIELIGPAHRNAGGHRVYERKMVETLRFIRRCRTFGFPIDEIRQLVPALGSETLPCAPARGLAENHLTRLEQQMKELRALRLSLSGLVEACRTDCCDGMAVECVLFEELRS